MSVSKLSFIVTAAAVVLAAINVIIRAVQHSPMLVPMILLGVMVAAFIFSLIVISGEKDKPRNENQFDESQPDGGRSDDE